MRGAIGTAMLAAGRPVEPTVLRAFLFDFDGTLADTEPLHLEAFRRVLGPRGIHLDEAGYFARYLVGTDRECLARMLADYGRRDIEPGIETLCREKSEAFEALLDATPPIFPGAREFVARAADTGPVVIVTGAVGSQVRRVLEATGLASSFAGIVAAEDVRHGKPDPEPYRLGIGLLRARMPDLEPAACLAVEDSPNGITSARRAGLRTLALTHSRPAADLAAADQVATSFLDVGWPPLGAARRR